MDELSINPETLISLVEERNILWDKTSESYKDKRQTLKAWHDLCSIIKEDFNDLPIGEKNTYGKFSIFYLVIKLFNTNLLI